MKIDLLGRRLVIRSPVKLYRLPTLKTIGLTNRTEDNYFVLFLDYDMVEYKVVLEDVDFLQKNYDLGTVLIRKTAEYDYKDELVGNFHVIGFTKYTFPEVREMIGLTRCDSHFKRAWKYQARCWVLRTLEKWDMKTNEVVKPAPEFHALVKAPTGRVANKGLIEYFEKLDNIKIRNHFNKIDDRKNVELITYVTR